MAIYNAGYEAGAKSMDEARAAAYVKMKEAMINAPLTNVSVAYNDYMSKNITSSIFPNVPVKDTTYKYSTVGIATTGTIKAGDMVSMSIYGGQKSMNIKASCVRVKAGFLAQIFNGSVIVWESKRTYKTAEKAMKVAHSKIDSSINKLFNK